MQEQRTCLLPQGFLSLAPEKFHPASSLPSSLTVQNAYNSLDCESSHTSLMQRINNSGQSRRQQLTLEAVSKIGGDSLNAQRDRILSYIREQPRSVFHISETPAPELPRLELLTTSANSGSVSILPKKSNEEIGTDGVNEDIERKNRNLDLLDVEEQDQRSLWSGGSLDTNGIDEYVSSEDEDEDSEDHADHRTTDYRYYLRMCTLESELQELGPNDLAKLEAAKIERLHLYRLLDHNTPGNNNSIIDIPFSSGSDDAVNPASADTPPGDDAAVEGSRKPSDAGDALTESLEIPVDAHNSALIIEVQDLSIPCPTVRLQGPPKQAPLVVEEAKTMSRVKAGVK